MAGTVKRKRSPLRGKGGLVAVAVVALLVVWYYLDLQKPVTTPGSPKAFELVGAQSKDITRVELDRPSGKLVLAKAGDGWSFEQPGQYAANPESVKTWLKGLLDDTDATVLEDRSPDLAKYGLDKPQVTLTIQAGGRTRTLQIGKEFKLPSQPKGERFYAREAGSGKLFMLPAGEVEGLRDKKIEDLRDKRLLVLGDEAEVSMITIQRGGQQVPVSVAGAAGTVHRGGETVILAREAEGRWKLMEPFSAPAQADDVSTLINRLKNAEADSFVEDAAPNLAKYGLDRPRMTVQLTTKQGSLGVLFGKAEKDGKVYAARENTNAVMLLSKLGFEDIDTQSRPAKLRERKLTTFDRDAITFFELKNQHGMSRLRKVGKQDWQLADEKDPKKNKANADKAQQVLDRLTGEATAHVEETPKDLARYGLDKPVINVVFSDGKSASQALLIGKKTKDGYYAKGAPNAVFEVSNYVFEDLNLKPADFKAPEE